VDTTNFAEEVWELRHCGAISNFKERDAMPKCYIEAGDLVLTLFDQMIDRSKSSKALAREHVHSHAVKHTIARHCSPV
jgi:hypothetical protein